MQLFHDPCQDVEEDDDEVPIGDNCTIRAAVGMCSAHTRIQNVKAVSKLVVHSYENLVSQTRTILVRLEAHIISNGRWRWSTEALAMEEGEDCLYLHCITGENALVLITSYYERTLKALKFKLSTEPL